MNIRTLVTAGLALQLAACASLAAGDPALYEGLGERDVALAAQLMQSTLENATDGTTRRWSNQESGNSGEITPLRTYVSDDGSFCREYREELMVAGSSGRFYHTACREGAARWAWL